MTLSSPTVSYPPIAIHDRPDLSDTAVVVWASIVLMGLAIVAVALLPALDPAIFVLS
jgi:hypothetical protein